MPVDFASIPVTNTLAGRISLAQEGLIRATLEPGEASVLTLRFDQVMLINPGHQPVVRTQNPNAQVGVHPFIWGI
jgi:hypothetical protein